MAATESRRQARLRALQQEAERSALKEELEEIRQSIHHAYAGFNRVSDPDLVEAWVYEINALQARHAYLLRQLRADGNVQPDASSPERARA